jgi:GTP cyclohydrolase III
MAVSIGYQYVIETEPTAVNAEKVLLEASQEDRDSAIQEAKAQLGRTIRAGIGLANNATAAQHAATLEAAGESKVSPTDPDL